MAVNNLDVGGLERLVISLLRHLPRDVFDLSLLCIAGRGKLFHEVDLPASACLVLDKAPVANTLKERARIPVLMMRVAQFLRDRQVDILNVHNLGPLLYAGMPARLLPRGPRVVYTEHNQIYRANEAGRRRFRQYARVAHTIITVSHDLERTLRQSIGITTPMHVIHNGIDGTRFGTPSDGALRRELGIDEEAFVFGTAVVISEQKGVTYLLDAAKQVLAEEPDSVFVIAGDGPLRKELEARAAADGLAGSVRFIGYRSDIPAVLASFDAYVLPSLWEGLPLALLEALAQGLVVVATSVGGNPEVIEHGENGFIVPPRDADALARHLLRVRREPELRERVRENNKRRFAERFSLDAMIGRYVALCESELS